MTLRRSVMLSSIRFLGSCPCPHCQITLDRVHELGMKQNKKKCLNKREDSYAIHHKIQTACRNLYIQGRGIKAAGVENVLKDDSLIPVEVSNAQATTIIECSHFWRTRSPSSSSHATQTSTTYSPLTLCTRSNWGCGSQPLRLCLAS